MSDVLLATRDIGVLAGGRKILSSVSIEVRRGEIVTIVGPNGSGKTTLMRVLIGALSPEEGEVSRKPDLVIGYVPQRLSVDRSMPLTVRRFLSLSAQTDLGARAEAMERTGIVGFENAQLADLSGGELQRALLARALLRRPDMLVLDEPTQGLDQPGTAQFYRMIEVVRAELGCAVVMVSHDLHVVMSASDRVICLNGHVCCQGAPTVVRSAPEYRALFGWGTEGTLALYRHEHDHHHGQVSTPDAAHSP